MKLPYKGLNSLGSEEFKHSIRRTKLREKRRHFYVFLFNNRAVQGGINTMLQNFMGFEIKIYRDKMVRILHYSADSRKDITDALSI